MSQDQPQQVRRPRGRIRGLLRGRARKIVALLVVAAAVVLYFRSGGEEDPTRTAFAARRGPLTISVVEGGNIEALESQTIKSNIKGQTKILTIVDEGYLVTPEDVASGKILVTLDDSELIERMTQETIEYQSAYANFTDAREQYEIQVKQNESDVTASELEVKFALMDFKKYLGDELADTIIDQQDLRVNVDEMIKSTKQEAQDRIAAGAGGAGESTEEEPLTGTSTDFSGTSAGDEVQGGDLPSDTAPAVLAKLESDAPADDAEAKRIALESEAEASRPAVDFTRYASPELLGDGEAQQLLRQLQSERLLSEEELQLAEVKLAGTRRLAERNFVTKQELDSDEMSVKKNTISRDSAITDEELFIKYEFPKQAEKLLSDYAEAIRKLERTIKKGIATEAQAEAKWKSSEANFKLREARVKELQDQLDSCTIPAERPGLVVYAGSDDPWRNQGQIEEGASVNERQEIITIPDMTQMAVKVKIHESSIKKIRRGQEARIRLDSYPEQELTGEVIKVNVLPDSGSRWMNPDMKLYPAMVSIDGTHDWLKPGMSAQVEILVEKLDDVVYVPIQAVSSENGRRVSYVVTASGNQERRVVETGDFNNEFIAIDSGLKEGERVMLRAPQRGPAAPQESDKVGDRERRAPGGAGPGGGERPSGRGQGGGQRSGGRSEGRQS